MAAGSRAAGWPQASAPTWGSAGSGTGSVAGLPATTATPPSSSRKALSTGGRPARPSAALNAPTGLDAGLGGRHQVKPRPWGCRSPWRTSTKGDAQDPGRRAPAGSKEPTCCRPGTCSGRSCSTHTSWTGAPDVRPDPSGGFSAPRLADVTAGRPGQGACLQTVRRPAGLVPGGASPRCKRSSGCSTSSLRCWSRSSARSPSGARPGHSSRVWSCPRAVTRGLRASANPARLWTVRLACGWHRASLCRSWGWSPAWRACTTWTTIPKPRPSPGSIRPCHGGRGLPRVARQHGPQPAREGAPTAEPRGDPG